MEANLFESVLNLDYLLSVIYPKQFSQNPMWIVRVRVPYEKPLGWNELPKI